MRARMLASGKRGRKLNSEEDHRSFHVVLRTPYAQFSQRRATLRIVAAGLSRPVLSPSKYTESNGKSENQFTGRFAQINLSYLHFLTQRFSETLSKTVKVSFFFSSKIETAESDSPRIFPGISLGFKNFTVFVTVAVTIFSRYHCTVQLLYEGDGRKINRDVDDRLKETNNF